MVWQIRDLIDTPLINKTLSYYKEEYFVSGAVSNPDKVRKNNLMMDPRPPYPEIAQEISHTIVHNDDIRSIFLVKYLSQVQLLWYKEDMYYNYHVDAFPIGGVNAHMSVSIFLNDDYEGGELVIKPGGVEVSFKPKPGDAIIYDTGLWHKVNPVTKGERKVIVGWMECMIPESFMRKHCIEYGYAVKDMCESKRVSDEDLNTLEQLRMNLIREYIR